HEAAIDLELAQIIVGSHVAAAIPAFVADAQIADLEGSRMTIGAALLRQRRRLSGRNVFQPFRRLPRSASAEVDREIGLRADLLEEVHELMRAERVRLDYAAPVGIQSGHSLRADAIAPVVFVREAAARPANVRNPQRPER